MLYWDAPLYQQLTSDAILLSVLRDVLRQWQLKEWRKCEVDWLELCVGVMPAFVYQDVLYLLDLPSFPGCFVWIVVGLGPVPPWSNWNRSCDFIFNYEIARKRDHSKRNHERDQRVTLWVVMYWGIALKSLCQCARLSLREEKYFIWLIP